MITSLYILLTQIICPRIKTEMITMLPLFTTVMLVIIFCAWLGYELKKSSAIVEKERTNRLELESKANSTRKKPINSLNYITISEKSILFLKINNDNIEKIQKEFKSLADAKILNLTHMTNTELKLEYGPANLPALSEADENFSTLVRLLHKYAETLADIHMEREAIEVLEYSLSIGSDMSISYKLLANLYLDNNMNDKIDDLLIKADSLTSLTKEPIKDYLISLVR